MTAADRERWDAKYAVRTSPSDIEPPEWLVERASHLKPGTALDVACGVGRAAIWLAERGWNVTAIDVSPIGLNLAKRLAASRQAAVQWILGDLDEVGLGEESFDLVTVFRFLDRRTLPSRITAALRPDGLLLYETFLAENCSETQHVTNRDFLLQPGELPSLFAGLRITSYEECRTASGLMARLLAQKP